VVNIAALDHLTVTPNQRRLLNALKAKYPHGSGLSDLADQVYAHDRNGGPEHGSRAVSVLLWALRPKLQSIGWDAYSPRRTVGNIRLWAPHELERLNA